MTATMAQAPREPASGGRREGVAAAAPHRRSMAMVVLLLIAVVLVVDGIAGERGWLANRRAAAQLQAAQDALKQAKARNAALRDEVRRFDPPDQAAIEEAARRQLGLMKPGEKLFILRDTNKADKK